MKTIITLLIIAFAIAILPFLTGCNSTGASRSKALGVTVNQPDRAISRTTLRSTGEIAEYTAYFELTEGEGEEQKTTVVTGTLMTAEGVYPAIVKEDDGTVHLLGRDTPIGIMKKVIVAGKMPSITVTGEFTHETFDPHALIKPPSSDAVWISGMNNATRAILGYFGFTWAKDVGIGGGSVTNNYNTPAP